MFHEGQELYCYAVLPEFERSFTKGNVYTVCRVDGARIWMICDDSTHLSDVLWTADHILKEMCIPLSYFTEEEQFYFKMSGTFEEGVLLSAIATRREEHE